MHARMGWDGARLTEASAAAASQLDRDVGPQSPMRPSTLLICCWSL